MKYKLLLVSFVLFTTNMLFSQSVVVNKYRNVGTTADIFELLVVQDNADLRNLVVKSFSGNNANDAGGSISFNNIAFWSSMRAGTLIVVTLASNAATDITTSCTDFNLNIGGSNATYFTVGSGTFDLANNDMCMIKSGTNAGVANNTNTLRAGSQAAQWTAIASGTKSGTNTTLVGSGTTSDVAFITNASSVIGDFNLNTLGVSVGSSTTIIFGSGNTTTNTDFINFLRGPVSTAATLIDQVSFSANWGAVTGATSYRLDVSTSSTFASFVSGYNDLNVGNVSTYSVTGLNPGTQYYYRVRAVNVTPTTSGNSCTQTLTTLNGKVSVASGDWNTAGTWNPVGVPVAGDNVIIQTGHIVSTSIGITGATARTGTTTVNGTFQLNAGGFASGVDFTYNATTGGLIFNTTYTANSGCYWPATSSPVNVTVNTACPLTLGFARTVSGVFQSFADVANPGNLTINGTLLLNAGYTFSGTGSPIYGASSLLKYNSGGTPGRGAEWVAASGTIGTTAGYPNNVQISASTNLNFPNGSTSTFKANGSVTIDASSNLSQNFAGGSAALIVGTDLILNGGLTLGTAASGDITVGGNWTKAAATATFTPNGRAVFFNGTTTQNLTVSPSGTETFNFLIVQGSGTLKPATGTNVVVNSSSGLTLSSSNVTSTIDLNGQTLTLSGGGNLDLSGGARNITSTGGAATVLISTSNLTVISGAGGSLTTATNILINLQRGLDCGTASLVTINGTLQINANGFCVGNSPRYGASSLLQYNTTGTYVRQLEWTSFTAAIGTPNNVQISNNTILNYYNAGNTGPKNIVGTLVVDAGSTFDMVLSGVTTGGAVTVPGDVTIAGTLKLGFASGDDLKTAGNLAFTGTGSLVGNSRAIFFTKNGTQTVSSVAALTIPYVVTAGSTGTTVQLLNDLIISSSAGGGNVVTLGNAADVIDINGKNLTIGSTGNAGVISGTGTFKGSTTSTLTLLGTGNIGTVTFASNLNLGTFTMNRTGGGIGCVMGSALTINAASATALTLTAGNIDLGANTMTIASGTALTSGSASSYVIADKTAGGIFSVAVTGNAITYKFPIGDSTVSNNGSEYSPCTVTFSTGTFASAFIKIGVDDIKDPLLDATNDYLSRYWNVTTSGTFTPSPKYTFIGTFIPGELVGSGHKANQWNGVKWLDNGITVVSPNIQVTSTTSVATSVVNHHFTAGNRDPEINIKQGATDYLTSSTYDFLTTPVGTPLIVTFTLQNLGQQVLNCTTGTLTGTYYTTSYSNPTNVNGGLSTTFTVTFTATTAGVFTGSISIANNDTSGGENPYVINFTGEATCTSTNTITPTSGPVGTEVTITATTNNLTGATVTILGAAASVTIIDATHITAVVPSAAVNGIGTLTTIIPNGCQASNVFTVDKNLTGSCQGGPNAPDLFISEVTDATYGGLTYVEIYNGTGANIDLTANSYSLQFFANGSASSYGTQALSGTIVNGTTYTVATSLSGYWCSSVTGGDGTKANLATAIAGINFADSTTGNTSLGHDHIALYKGAVKKDSWGVYLDQTWATSLSIGDRGADFRRKNNVTLPNTTYSNSDWDIIDWSGTGTSSCANNDYSDIGIYNFLTGTPPTVTANPTYSPTCKTASLTVAGTEGFVGGNPLAYQWYAVAPGVATWTAITNGALYSGATSATLNLLNTTTLIGYQFYCLINENTSTCHAATNAVKIVPGTTLTWNGSAWTGGPPATPTLTTAVIINGNYDMATQPSFEACSVTVNSPNVLTITAGNYVSIQNDLTVTAPGNVVVQNNGSIVQIDNNGVNTGSVTVNRTATAKLSDYIYWSSPVANFPTTSVSPTTSTSLIWKWNPTVPNSNNGEGIWQNAAADIMSAGKGYIIRAPNSFNNTTAANFTAPFIGIPFNGIKQPSIARGDITTVLGSYPAAPYAGTNGAIISEYSDNMNLVGNPYPSAIKAIDFLNLNTNILGNIRLWTHGSLPVIASNPYYGNYAYNYAPGDYITYNASGVSSGPSAFSGYVASGQGFFVIMNDGAPNASQTVTFNNALRSSYSAPNYSYFDNSNFYRNAANHNTTNTQDIERNRIWMDLIDATGNATRTLVGYIEGATIGTDRLFDANVTVGNSQNFYSLIENKSYSIQGRALPFDADDRVPLGVKLPIAATYTIAIAATDGLFQDTNRGIYLEDIELNSIHDLRQAPYVFTSESGRFDTRFILRYTNSNALGTVGFDALTNSVVVSTPNHNQINIKSYLENMKSVEVYDVLGRTVYTNKQVNLKELIVPNVTLSQQALIVKITLENGIVVTKKIVL